MPVFTLAILNESLGFQKVQDMIYESNKSYFVLIYGFHIIKICLICMLYNTTYIL